MENYKNILTLLKEHIDDSGYTVYSISREAGINRSTLQKMLSGQRPLTKEAYQALMPLFHLSPVEREQCDHSFLISQIGENRYKCHMLLKSIFEQPPRLSDFAGSGTSTAALEHNMNTLPDTFAISDRVRIIYTIRRIIDDSIASHDAPYLHTFIDFQGDFSQSLCSHLINSECKNLEITHLLEFTKPMSSGVDYDNIYNMTTFTHLLPFIGLYQGAFRIYYYYTTLNTRQDEALVLPHYIITNDYVILLSSDYDYAYFTKASELHSYYDYIYSKTIRRSNLLTDGLRNSLELLDGLIQDDGNGAFANCLTPQPCLEMFIDEDMINRYLRESEFSAQIGLRFKQRVNQLQTHKGVNIFTRGGLQLFVQTGRVLNIPEELAPPFSIDDRITLLERLYDANQQHYLFTMLNDSLFAADTRVTIVPTEKNGQLLLSLAPDSLGMIVLNITEHTLYHTAVDFTQNIFNYGYAYSTEETQRFIAEAIEELKNM